MNHQEMLAGIALRLGKSIPPHGLNENNYPKCPIQITVSNNCSNPPGPYRKPLESMDSLHIKDKNTIMNLALPEHLASFQNAALRTQKTTVRFNMAGGSYTQMCEMAETKGFEPSRQLPVYSLSRGAPSTTRPRLRLPV